MERRTFVRYIGTLGTVALLMPDLLACNTAKSKISVNRLGAPLDRGHLLRGNFDFARDYPVVKMEIPAVIIGGGISGLSTGYHLQKNGFTDFLLLELNESVGGNSGFGENRYSKYPLGAHYLSLANPNNRALIDFLKEQGLITREEDGRQYYLEDFLCHAPDERLLFKGVFHEGLVPEYGISPETHAEITRFFDQMKVLKEAKNTDGIDLFNIPISQASINSDLEALDKITFRDYLNDQGYHSEELHWFLDYCCRDDFGAGSDKVSAWAGIHYFAGRKAKPGNTDPTTVLTWSEGNGFLTNILEKSIREQVKTNVLVYSVEELEDRVFVQAVDLKTQKKLHIHAESAVISSPSYVAKHILRSPSWPQSYFERIHHNPWLIGIVVVDEIPEGNGTPLAWDNVKFGTKGLGYVSDRHQEFGQHRDKHVISVYLALDREDEQTERRKLFQMTDEEMCGLVVSELTSMHPLIEQHIQSISFQRWGHGMVTPYPGALAKYQEYLRLKSNAKRVHLAHTDYSSYSVFEEGFDLGLLAANKLVNHEA
ncbi:FAD-dependent oxidoreductase [uncultured Fluviicola sp.]|uniref:FAD-dependent oxidoreductase n=1 Tax=uncultured Fluviicola sp. TaxID=463303 RepID=UPI0025FC4BC5|nr:FAD-dependent oxidoreductase [uncultured Fluviicola sp.]